MLKKIMKKFLVGTMVLVLGVPPVPIQSAYLQETDVKGERISNEEEADVKVVENISIENSGLKILNSAEIYQSGLEVMATRDTAGTSGIISGICGENVTYELNLDTGNVVIRGTGAMKDYERGEDSPFFAYSDVIQSVTIEEGVTSVGAALFGFCFNLESVTLPQSVTKIGNLAFLGCVSMEMLSVSENVTNIGDYALGYYCVNGKEGKYANSNLTILGISGSAAESYATTGKIDFIDTATMSNTCGENVFWSFDSNTGTLTISGEGDMEDYRTPIYYDMTRPSFDIYKSQITSVVIEEGVTNIGTSLFYDYSKLTEVILPDSLTYIKSGAFEQCINLENIILPDNLESIGRDAFLGCKKLKRIAIPKNVSGLSSTAFNQCSNLTGIDVDPESQYYLSEKGVVFTKFKQGMCIFPAGYEESYFEVPKQVQWLSEYCFTEFKHLKSLIINNEKIFENVKTQNMQGLNIFYMMESELPQNVLEKWNCQDTNFINLNQVPGLMEKDTLSIESDTNQLAAGESMQLFARISPLLASDFIWISSDENVAVVSKEGRLLALNPGTTTVQVKSRDNQYSAEAVFQVTGEAFVLKDYDYAELSEELVKQTYALESVKQIVCEKLHGIYFVNKDKLFFYSFRTESYEEIYKFPGCRSAYAANDKLYVLFENTCYVYDLITRSVPDVFHIGEYEAVAIGADHLGRIYISGSKLMNSCVKKVILYSPEGEKLSEMPLGTTVYDFAGFDSRNGHFYMESYYDYYAWGYSHPGRGLTMGKVTGNSIKYIDTQYSFLESGLISRSMSCMLFLCQTDYMCHQNSAALIGDKYLVAASVLHSSLNVMDSDAVNQNGIDTILRVNRPAVEEGMAGETADAESIGTRAVYNEKNNSIVLYENNRTISEYSLTTGEKTATFQTKNRVYNLLKMGEHIIAIEKENEKFYMEIVNWKAPEEVKIHAQTTEMQVGALQQLSVSSESLYTNFVKWSSNDKSIATVSENGFVSTWKEGTVVITATLSDSVTASITIVVSPSQTVAPKKNVIHLPGAETNNLSKNHYTMWSKVVTSYLAEKENGTLEQIEYTEKDIQIKTYTKDFQLISTKILPVELTLFGGIYHGEDSNFLVFGQENPTERDEVEVLRIVKYNKDWERMDSVSVKGANTSIPFEAGALRMTETDEKLYIHTCHEMYTSSDGLNHQANMTFVLNEETMEIEQSYYDVMNLAQAGYVSHSFNQFVETDGEYVYRVDHGDANPRAVTLSKCKVNGDITEVEYILPFTMEGASGYNYTGVSIGGFELSSDNCLIVGNSVDQTDYESFITSNQWNIFLTVTDKNLTKAKTVWLTEYPEKYNVTVRTPYLVKLNEEQFLVMWEEVDNQTSETIVKMVCINSNGEICSEITETGMQLSDCKPIVTSDGLVKWYLTNKTETFFCMIDPYNLSGIKDSVSEIKKLYIAKEELKAIIEKGTDKESTDYTEESWAVYEAAYEKAQNLLQKEDVTLEEVEEAKVNLEFARKGLVTKEVYVAKMELKAVIENGSDKKSEDYTEESWVIYEAAYERAQDIFEDNDVTLEEVEEAKANLETALQGLVTKEVYAARMELKAAIEKGVDKELSDYTEESWSVYEEAYEEAVRIFEREDATVKALKEAKENLESAEKGLVTKIVYAARMELKAAIEKGVDKESADYTEESWSVYEEAYEEAVRIFEREDATEKALKEAKENLESARNKLITKEMYAAKMELKAVMEKGAPQEWTEYVFESWLKYQEAYEEAERIFESTNITIEDVEEAKANLEAALKGLVTKEVYAAKEELQDEMKKINVIKSEDYTSESWLIYKRAYNEAESIVKSNDVTIEEVIKAREKLEATRNALVTKELDTARMELKAIIENKIDKESTDYTAESWMVYEEAYEEAVGIFEREDATVETLKEAKEKLELAQNGLVTKEVYAAKMELEAEIKKEADIKSEDYTEESWSVYQSAYREALGWLESDNAMVEFLKKARENLESALKGLVTKELYAAKVELEALINKELPEEWKEGVKEWTEYIVEIWAVYETAYDEAMNIFERKNVTIEEVKEARENLESARNGLILKELYIAQKELKALIEKGTAKESTDYIAESWSVYELAYQEALRIFEKEDATVEALKEAKANLESAEKGLVTKEVYAARMELEAEIKKEAGIKMTDYTSESWLIYIRAYQEAVRIFEKEDATIEALKEAKEKLEKAYNALVRETKPEGGSGNNADNEKPDSYEEILAAQIKLYDIIENCSNSLIGDYRAYTADSWAAYIAANMEAMDLRLAEYGSVTVKQLVEAGEKLEKAFQALVLVVRPGGNGSSSGNNQENNSQNDMLKQEISNARMYLTAFLNYVGKEKATDYTTDSWNAYTVIYNEAKHMSQNENASLAQLTEVKIKLQNAFNALVHVSLQKEEKPENKPQESKPESNMILKQGEKFTIGNDKFMVKNEKEAVFTGVSKRISKVKIANTVTYKGKVLKVTSISAKALRNNKVVTQIRIGTNVTVIGKSAFEGCVKLKSITFGKNTKIISEKALKGCKALKNITIPAKVTTIGKSAFEKCSKLQKITIQSTKLKTVQKKAFSGIKINAKIKVPKKSRTKYKKLLKNKGQGKKVTIS